MATYPKLLKNSENPLKPSAWMESDQIEFAYWVPNISGGLVITTLPMDTDWTPEANIKYARDAEEVGFATALRKLAGLRVMVQTINMKHLRLPM